MDAEWNDIMLLDKIAIRNIQLKMVAAFNNYHFAKESWGLLVVSSRFNISIIMIYQILIN